MVTNGNYNIKSGQTIGLMTWSGAVYIRRGQILNAISSVYVKNLHTKDTMNLV